MSWSVNFIGLPGKISEALKDYSEKLTGTAKEEFDAALPGFIVLLSQNYDKVHGDPVLSFAASGHGYAGYSSLSTEIKCIGGSLV